MIEDRSEKLRTLYARAFAADPPNGRANSNGHRTELGDEEVIDLARGARNGAKFEALWAGDTNGYASPSEADQALIGLLAFYTQDEEQLDRLFGRSGLCRDKWLERPDYRRRTIQRALSNLTETYAPSDDGARMVVGKGENLSSQRPRPLIGIGTQGRKPEAIRFSEMPVPAPRRYLLKDLVLAAYVSLLHGDGGVAKSLLVLALAIAVSGRSGTWLRRDVEHGPVLYLDFELDAEEQSRRVRQLCRGAGLVEPPEDLFYMSAVGFTAREAFGAAREMCEEHGIKMLVVDSYGMALQGDAEASRDVIGFHRQVIEPIRALGVAVVIVDHQSKMQAGQSYQQKGAFGSVYKSNLARSVIQVEAAERGEGTLTVKLRQKKHNFGPLAEPFAAKLVFTEDAITIEPVELGAAELAEEATLNAADRVRLALEDGPAYPDEIAAHTGLALKTVQNTLTGLRKRGTVKTTGKVLGRAEQVELGVPASPSLIGGGDAGTMDEDYASPLLRPQPANGRGDVGAISGGELGIDAVITELVRPRSGPALALGTYREKPDEQRLEWLTKSVLRAMGMDVNNWKSHVHVVEAATGRLAPR